MSDVKLLPCPFCGGEARVNTLPWMGGYTATALCKNEPNVHYLNTWDEDEAKAVERITEAWNTRAERTCVNELDDGHFGCSVCGCHVRNLPLGSTYVSDGKRWYSTEKRTLNYCPNCGAKVVNNE